MTKHRLEIFSDGVFSIVLTLLVLDLRLPQAHGAASLREIAPELMVHAGGFFIVGAFWINHHKVLSRITEITGGTLLLNLLALFWITLVPFATKSAVERPMEPLGASFISGCCGAYLLSILGARITAHSYIDDEPRLRAWRDRRRLLIGGVILADFAGAALAWVDPWAGYAAALGTVVLLLALPTAAQARLELERLDAEGAAIPISGPRPPAEAPRSRRPDGPAGGIRGSSPPTRFR